MRTQSTVTTIRGLRPGHHGVAKANRRHQSDSGKFTELGNPHGCPRFWITLQGMQPLCQNRSRAKPGQCMGLGKKDLRERAEPAQLAA